MEVGRRRSPSAQGRRRSKRQNSSKSGWQARGMASRGPGFGSQHPHHMAPNHTGHSGPRVSDTSSEFCRHCIHRPTHRHLGTHNSKQKKSSLKVSLCGASEMARWVQVQYKPSNPGSTQAQFLEAETRESSRNLRAS